MNYENQTNIEIIIITDEKINRYKTFYRMKYLNDLSNANPKESASLGRVTLQVHTLLHIAAGIVMKATLNHKNRS